jgi:hypothetical protein
MSTRQVRVEPEAPHIEYFFPILIKVLFLGWPCALALFVPIEKRCGERWEEEGVHVCYYAALKCRV